LRSALAGLWLAAAIACAAGPAAAELDVALVNQLVQSGQADAAAAVCADAGIKVTDEEKEQVAAAFVEVCPDQSLEGCGQWQSFLAALRSSEAGRLIVGWIESWESAGRALQPDIFQTAGDRPGPPSANPLFGLGASSPPPETPTQLSGPREPDGSPTRLR
jgi:hypothetical protein